MWDRPLTLLFVIEAYTRPLISIECNQHVYLLIVIILTQRVMATES